MNNIIIKIKNDCNFKVNPPAYIKEKYPEIISISIYGINHGLGLTVSKDARLPKKIKEIVRVYLNSIFGEELIKKIRTKQDIEFINESNARHIEASNTTPELFTC